MMYTLDNRGMISFLVVFFVSVLLVLITAAFAQFMIRELRQSTDSELSSKAYYAAESGVEEGLLELRNAVEAGELSSLETDDCVSGTFSDTTGFSCRLITLEPNLLEGSLEPDTSRQFNLSGVSHSSIHLQWHQRGEGGDYTGGGVFDVPTGGNPPAEQWPAATPPVMRIEVVSYPNTNFDDNQIAQRVAFVYPGSSGGSSTTLASMDGNQFSAQCDRNVGEGDYACSFSITGMGGNNHVVRIRPMYSGTSYGLEALDGDGNPVPISDNTAIIDVTGYASDVYRRVQVSIPLESVNQSLGSDYVLLADEGICKVMLASRLENRARPESGCLPGD